MFLLFPVFAGVEVPETGEAGEVTAEAVAEAAAEAKDKDAGEDGK